MREQDIDGMTADQTRGLSVMDLQSMSPEELRKLYFLQVEEYRKVIPSASDALIRACMLAGITVAKLSELDQCCRQERRCFRSELSALLAKSGRDPGFVTVYAIRNPWRN